MNRSSMIAILVLMLTTFVGSGFADAIVIPFIYRPSPVITQPAPLSVPTPLPTPPAPPDFDAQAAPDGTMTPCQKQQYWLKRSFVNGVNSGTDMSLAIYYQKECRG